MRVPSYGGKPGGRRLPAPAAPARARAPAAQLGRPVQRSSSAGDAEIVEDDDAGHCRLGERREEGS